MVNVPDGVVAQYARELGRLPLRLEGGGGQETAWLPSVSPLALVRWRASTPAGRVVSPILSHSTWPSVPFVCVQKEPCRHDSLVYNNICEYGSTLSKHIACVLDRVYRFVCPLCVRVCRLPVWVWRIGV